MAVKKDKQLLYEVMRGSHAARPGSAGNEVVSGGVDAGTRAEPTGGRSGATSGGLAGTSVIGAPVVLRLPRGYAILMGVGILLLIVLSYWAGSARGDRRGFERSEKRWQAMLEQRQPREASLAMFGPPMVDAYGAEDPRKVGLSYFHLGTYPARTHALDLVEFLRAHGLAAFATMRHNGRFDIWAGQGFVADESARPARQMYYNEILRIGQKWKAFYGLDDLAVTNLVEYQRPRPTG